MRIFHKVSRRPVGVVSAGLGVAAVLIPAIEGDGSANNESALDYLFDGINELRAGSTPNSWRWIPNAYVGGVKKMTWVGPAIGAAITGYVSRRFKV